MLGRVLFALVWLVIAAGFLLPLYPSDVAAPRSAAVDPVPSATGSRTAACEDCPVTDAGSADCEVDCRCGHLLPAALVAVDDSFGLSIILLIQRPPAGPSSERQPLPRLPAI
jgi:hypothetical protein